MADVIQRAFVDSPFMLEWFRWGAIVGFLITVVVMIWIFADAQRLGIDAVAWKSLAAVASVLAIPAVLARLHGGFASEMQDSLQLIGLLSIAAVLLSVVAAIIYSTTRTQVESYGGGGFRVAEPFDSGTAGDSLPPTEGDYSETGEIVGRTAGGGGPVPRKRTVLLQDETRPRAMAFLVITSGPYAGTSLPLDDEVTRIGRDGERNDHAIDDDSVSTLHVSVRHKDGAFTLTDLDSANGTRVNGTAVQQVVLTTNDEIQIGRTRLTFMQVASGVAPEDDQTAPIT